MYDINKRIKLEVAAVAGLNDEPKRYKGNKNNDLRIKHKLVGSDENLN